MEPIFIAKKALIINSKEKYTVFKKKQHLVKPFVLCTSNGYIIEIYGLYPATKNDASILECILSKNPNLIEKSDCNEEVDSLLRENAILILDRGFRNAANLL